jgi:hypothetical protein
MKTNQGNLLFFYNFPAVSPGVSCSANTKYGAFHTYYVVHLFVTEIKLYILTFISSLASHSKSKQLPQFFFPLFLPFLIISSFLSLFVYPFLSLSPFFYPLPFWPLLFLPSFLSPFLPPLYFVLCAFFSSLLNPFLSLPYSILLSPLLCILLFQFS